MDGPGWNTCLGEGRASYPASLRGSQLEDRCPRRCRGSYVARQDGATIIPPALGRGEGRMCC